MINHISIKNFAIIENAEVDFSDGLNIITGETGAGKSIVIGAISLALGDRADTSSIRTGADKAIVSLQGELDGKEVVISREVTSNGKNLCKLNGEIVTLANLNEVSKKLADIHGQYDNQSLLNPDYHIELLDQYESNRIKPLKDQVGISYSEFSDAKSKLIQLLNLERDNAKKRDFYQFEIAEIDKANLSINEDTELEDKLSVLQNSEKIFQALDRAYSSLENTEGSAIESLGSAKFSLEEISKYSAELESISEEFNDCYYKLQDLSSNLRSIRESLTFSPKELDDTISRLSLIDGLKKKYGDSIQEILDYRDRISNELSIIENFDDEKLKLEKELLDKKHDLENKCNELSDIRKEVAIKLSNKVQLELSELNFQDSKIEISIEKLPSPTENGFDKVEILISTNKGEPLKPLYKVASGGEMSRIMLAFKNIISSYDQIYTLIFDEIDNGISGVTASIVGKKLKEISKSHQIICITHLPQIASCGKNNYKIFKESDNSKTYTSIIHLNETEKIDEIARLLGGTNITETTLKSAKELIDTSK